jgi:hypothetical protein
MQSNYTKWRYEYLYRVLRNTCEGIQFNIRPLGKLRNYDMGMHYTDCYRSEPVQSFGNILKWLAETHKFWYFLTLSIPVFSSNSSALLIYFCENRYFLKHKEP